MYDRLYLGRRALKPNFIDGVNGFITWAFAQERCRSEGGVRCPCLKCGCRYIISDPAEITRHLHRKGFIENYWVWTYNGETLPSNIVPETSNTDASSSRPPVHLAYEAYLGGPVQYGWIYPFERFMGDSKRSVKNKARVEGSICAHYLHRETSHFCSHYFKHLMLTPRVIRNPVNVIERSQYTLSVFGVPGRPSGKKGEHWLTQQEMQSAHVHVLINYIEVKPYLEEFNNAYFDSTGIQSTSGVIHAQFPSWFKEKLYRVVAPTPEIIHLKNLSNDPRQSVNTWHTYFVNGYKFHTHEWTEGKKTINSGVFVKRVTDGGEDDFYGFVKHIYELVYNYLDSENKVVLFYCEWYDPTRGTKIDKTYGTVEIQMDRRYKEYDPFIMSNIVRQVYYVPYPSFVPRKRGCCVVIKTKPLGHIETDDLVEDVAYQVDEVEVNNVIPDEHTTSLSDTMVEGNQVDEDHEDHEDSGSEDNITSDDEDDMDDELDDLE